VKSGESSRTTHGDIFYADACCYFGALIAATVCGTSNEELLSARCAPVNDYWEQRPLAPEIAEFAGGSFKKQNPPAIKGTGYMVQSPEAALLKAKDARYSNGQIGELLQASADDPGVKGQDSTFGAGRANALRAITSLP